MSFSIKWHPQAFKILKKLPKPMIERVMDKFDEVVEEPFRFLEHYEGEKVYKLRVGEYRALVELDFQNRLLIVKVFDHRKRIYKR